MSRLIEVLRRVAKRAGCAAAVLAVPLAMLASAGSGMPAEAPPQLAQSPPRTGAPQRQAQPAAPAAGEQEIERQIGDLRRRLAIIPAQQAQFDALAQAMRQNAEAMKTLAPQEQQNQKPNAVDAVRLGQRFAAAEADGLQRLLPPLQALYESLSDQQKRAADQVFASNPEPEPQPAAKRR